MRAFRGSGAAEDIEKAVVAFVDARKPTRIAHEGAHSGIYVRPPIQRNDAHLVDHATRDAPVLEALILPGIVLVSLSGLLASGVELLRFSSPAVLWVACWRTAYSSSVRTGLTRNLRAAAGAR
jgi:hypothetical protein